VLIRQYFGLTDALSLSRGAVFFAARNNKPEVKTETTSTLGGITTESHADKVETDKNQFAAIIATGKSLVRPQRGIF
jgi:hypothetical protein